MIYQAIGTNSFLPEKILGLYHIKDRSLVLWAPLTSDNQCINNAHFINLTEVQCTYKPDLGKVL